MVVVVEGGVDVCGSREFGGMVSLLEGLELSGVGGHGGIE